MRIREDITKLQNQVKCIESDDDTESLKKDLLKTLKDIEDAIDQIESSNDEVLAGSNKIKDIVY